MLAEIAARRRARGRRPRRRGRRPVRHRHPHRPSPSASSTGRCSTWPPAAGPVVVVAGNHDSAGPAGGGGPAVRRPAASRWPRPSARRATAACSRSRSGGETALVALLPFPSQRYVVTADLLLARRRRRRPRRLRRPGAAHPAACSPRGFRRRHRQPGGRPPHGASAARWAAASGAPTRCSTTGCPPPRSRPAAQYVALGHLHRAQQLRRPGPAALLRLAAPARLRRDGQRPGGERRRRAAGQAGRRAGGAADGRAAGCARCGARSSTCWPRRPAPSRRRATATRRRRVVARPPAGRARRVAPGRPGRRGARAHPRRPSRWCWRLARATPGAGRVADPDRLRRTPHDLFAEYLAEHDVADDRLVPLFDELVEEVTADDRRRRRRSLRRPGDEARPPRGRGVHGVPAADGRSTSPAPTCSPSSVPPAPARPASSTPSRSPSTARCPGSTTGGRWPRSSARTSPRRGCGSTSRSAARPYTAVRVVRATKAGGATTKEARLERSRRGAGGHRRRGDRRRSRPCSA